MSRIFQLLLIFHYLTDAMAAADPPNPFDPLETTAQVDDVDASLSQFPAMDTDSGSEGYDDAIQEFPHEFNDDDIALPSRRGASVMQQVLRVSVQLDKFQLSLLNTLGLWSNPILEVHLTDTMVDYLVATDTGSSMGLNSCIMLTQWNPICKVIFLAWQASVYCSF
jgi:hypothetical protein